MPLKEYRAKRDFRRTNEPSGSSVQKSARGKKQPSPEAAFVVQKHAATRLHYDFRLEMAGVLKSWAVPKGFPTRKGDRRLAVEVEDHPLDYADFEGTIPPGNYGAGTVMIWDHGTYSDLGGHPERSLAAGKLHLQLAGQKLKGVWTLVRLKHGGRSGKPEWLLLKTGTDVREFSPRQERRSAISGRTLEDIAAENDRQWQSHRPSGSKTKPSPATRQPATAASSQRPDQPRSQRRHRVSIPRTPRFHGLAELPVSEPAFVPPMKAVLSRDLPAGENWIYEIKWDGIRALAVKNRQEVQLYSRAGKDLTPRFPELARQVSQLGPRRFVLDGEIVALDPEGRPSFQLLQSQAMDAAPAPTFYYLFDLVNLEGRDTTQLPLHRRKALLELLVSNPPPGIRYSGPIQAQSRRVLEAMKARGLEGLLAKQHDSIYDTGQRSRSWLKVKWSNEQEFVIGGYTAPAGARGYFGALLVGYYENQRLVFAGKVGTGYTFDSLRSLHARFQPLVTKACPFANLPDRRSGGGGVTAAEMRHCTWLRPELVCQVRFAEWTRDGSLRQPSFLGLREDKAAAEVTRET